MLTERDRLLVSELARLKRLTGEQAGRLCGFCSKTRWNERFLKLVRAGILCREFTGTIAGGRAAVYRIPGLQGRLASSRQMIHQLMISEVYTRLRDVPADLEGVLLRRFETECTGLLPADSHLEPDAYLEVSVPSGVRASFLEVDRGTEALPVWRRKVERYLTLARSGDFSERTGHDRFSVLVVAHSERRVQGIRAVVRSETEKIFYFTDLSRIKSEGAYASVWLRPSDDARFPLISKGVECDTVPRAVA